MRVMVHGVDVGARVASYKSPTIDPQLRTFEVKCTITEPPPGVVPGAMADIALLLEEREGLGVPREALQERGGGTVLFVIEDETARMRPVQAGLETGDWVEVHASGLAPGTPVVTMGQFLLNDGTLVAVQRGDG
jgi:multidrug efflux pump subunit AcrA (membrane-fusion protein)